MKGQRLTHWHWAKWNAHGEAVLAEMERKLRPNQRFKLTELVDQITVLSNLSQSTAYDVVLAICGVLRRKGILEKQGRGFVFKPSPATPQAPEVLREECGSCRYGCFASDRLTGRCHRYPPVFVSSSWEWPPVNRADYCGEWKLGKSDRDTAIVTLSPAPGDAKAVAPRGVGNSRKR